jgi:hypothetical protein
MRRLLFTVLLALVLASCGDIARTKVDLRFPDGDTRESTQQLLFIVREPVSSGDPCSALWGPPPSGLGEYARLVDYPNPADVLAAPLQPGTYTMFAYGLPARLDVLCDSDDKCKSSSVGESCKDVSGGQRACLPGSGSIQPIVGGCAGGEVSESEVQELLIELQPAPRR